MGRHLESLAIMLLVFACPSRGSWPDRRKMPDRRKRGSTSSHGETVPKRGSTSSHGETVASWVRSIRTCNVSQPDARPNILFLQADDLARAAISSYGGHLSSVLRTPNIDKLAAEGARFERSFVTNSLCAPSRTVILTGLHSHENGVIQIGQSALSNGQLPKSDPKSNGRVFQIPRRVKSYPELLRSSGHYSTAQFGKYHSHDWLFGVRAFEYFRPFEKHISWNPPLCDPREHRRCAPEATKGFETELLADLAIEWLRPWTDTESRKDCRPFYLEVDFKATHEPWDHPKHVDGLYRDVVFPEPAGLQHVWGGATSDATAVREAAQVA